MAEDFMGRLAAGLRGAGSVLSPQVFRGMEAERLQQGQFEGQMQRDRQIQQFRQQQQQEQDQAISRVVGPYIQKGDFAGAAKAAAATPGMFDVGMKLWGQVEARSERAEAAASRLVLKMVSSKFRCPTNAPVFTSMVAIASVCSIIK